LDFGAGGENRAAPVVEMAVNRQPFLLFPHLDRPHFAVQRTGDLLPGIQAIVIFCHCETTKTEEA
jgi:hypothetical protein